MGFRCQGAWRHPHQCENAPIEKPRPPENERHCQPIRNSETLDRPRTASTSGHPGTAWVSVICTGLACPTSRTATKNYEAPEAGLPPETPTAIHWTTMQSAMRQPRRPFTDGLEREKPFGPDSGSAHHGEKTTKRSCVVQLPMSMNNGASVGVPRSSRHSYI